MIRKFVMGLSQTLFSWLSSAPAGIGRTSSGVVRKTAGLKSPVNGRHSVPLDGRRLAPPFNQRAAIRLRAANMRSVSKSPRASRTLRPCWSCATLALCSSASPSVVRDRA